jgi:hypothetical protein
MRVMPGNHSSGHIHHWATRFPAALGHLYSPAGFRGPFPWLPYALDNGAYSAYTKQQPWPEAPFRELLRTAAASKQDPLWVVVPDVVGDAEATFRKWHEWAPRLQESYPTFPLALAVQDGMTIQDIQRLDPQPQIVFVGGTTGWKRRTIGYWCRGFPRVHVARINSYRWLWICATAGAESVDGTGWFRAGQRDADGLYAFITEWAAGLRTRPAKPWLSKIPMGR